MNLKWTSEHRDRIITPQIGANPADAAITGRAGALKARESANPCEGTREAFGRGRRVTGSALATAGQGFFIQSGPAEGALSSRAGKSTSTWEGAAREPASQPLFLPRLAFVAPHYVFADRASHTSIPPPPAFFAFSPRSLASL